MSELIQKFNINVTGILHIGAHTCEELSAYLQSGININNIYWITEIPDEYVPKNCVPPEGGCFW